jgi:hypothetical protein
MTNINTNQFKYMYAMEIFVGSYTFGVNPAANDPALAAVTGRAEIIRPQILNET